MECVSSTIEPEVMPEFVGVSTTATAFFRVASSLDQLDGKEAIQKHTLLSTGRGHLVEIEGGKIQRSTPCAKDITKIVVHHDFEPLQLYIVLLCGSGTSVLLAYQDMEVLHKWEGVRDIASADSKATGTPQLILTMQDGQAEVISNAKLMSYAYGSSKKREEEEEEREDTAAGRKEVVQALKHRFKGGIKHAEQLRTERKMKEDFITEELAALQSQLQGKCHDKERTLVPTLNIEERETRSKENVPPQSPNPLKVQRVYHKLIHDKWVVGVNVTNEGEKVLVSDLELILCCREVPLCHTSQVLKTVRHSRQGEADVRVTIDRLDPPVLRPKKKATVVGVCEVPSFEMGPSVSCSGLLSYTCKPLQIASSQPVNTNEECQSLEYQVSVPVVELKASELHNHQASLELCNSSTTAFVTFSIVALVAASRCTQVSLTSLVSPLNTFIDNISRHHKLNKVSGVSDFYVLHPRESHPLQHTGFTLHPVNSHHLDLILYTKDAKQAYVLAHTLLATLPEDASMQFVEGPKDTGNTAIQPHNLNHMLMAKMREAATHVTDGLEAQLTTSKAPRTERKVGSGEQEDNFTKYTKEREELLARKGNITFKEEEYSVWRKKLQEIQTEVDSLYLQFLKVNCASD
ncbi:uncharacterized protein LOC123503286 isoform X2 [Portunus trituberculatus]|uniref:uncharacterized protein LOC123503286 isoform X2 n=1 Tax=Portunus trituberculatus TaxID=210409 RepID=UPI001E1CB51D|nr:uncharacterized protein LOC123503286 isoform X2 [Portunus trituberculatus]